MQPHLALLQQSHPGTLVWHALGPLALAHAHCNSSHPTRTALSQHTTGLTQTMSAPAPAIQGTLTQLYPRTALTHIHSSSSWPAKAFIHTVKIGDACTGPHLQDLEKTAVSSRALK